MANYDEQRGAWTDYSGSVHNTEQDANNANNRLMGDRDGSSTSSYNPVDLNSPEYNRKVHISSGVTDADIEHDAEMSLRIVRRPIDMLVDLEKEGYKCMKNRDKKGEAEAFRTLYDILATPDWEEYYRKYFQLFPDLDFDAEKFKSFENDKEQFLTYASMGYYKYACEKAEEKKL